MKVKKTLLVSVILTVVGLVLYFQWRDGKDDVLPGAGRTGVSQGATGMPPAPPDGGLPPFLKNREAAAARNAVIRERAAAIRQETLAALRLKEPKTAGDYSLLALNSTGAVRAALLAAWAKLEPDNAAPLLLGALDAARAGRAGEALPLAKEALKLPRAEDHACANIVAEARKVAAASGLPLFEVYGATASDGPEYTQSASGQFRDLGEILMGDLMDSETPREPRPGDEERWLTTLSLANRAAASTTQTLTSRLSALEAERELIRLLPGAFASALDRPKTQYVEELTAERSSVRPLMGIWLNLSSAPAERIEEFLEATERAGEWEALTRSPSEPPLTELRHDRTLSNRQSPGGGREPDLL